LLSILASSASRRTRKSFAGNLWMIGSLVVLTAGAAGSWAADWPHFLGPDGNNVVTDAKVARTWPATGPKMLWTVAVGQGFGCPAVVAGKVYFLDQPNNRQEVFRVFNLADGKEQWTAGYNTSGNTAGFPGTRSTPSVEGNFAYTVGTFGEVYCWDLTNKKAAWHKSLPNDLGGAQATWGFAQSPLVYKDVVIVSPQGKSAGLTALNKKTGEVVWKSKVIGGQEAYTSPKLATIGGVEQIIGMHNGGIAGLDPTNGQFLWEYHGYNTDRGRPIPDPLLLPEGKIFLSSGYGAGSAIIQVTKDAAGKFSAKELFNTKNIQAKMTAPVFYKDNIYVNNGDNSNGLQCLDLNGKSLWQSGRSKQFDNGGMLIADGLIFLMGGDNGVLHLIEANSAGFKEIAQAQILSGNNIWGCMALADGKLLCRDQKQLKCVDVSAK
jgi:outer membrane protein assembly factor BamB